MAAEAQCRGTLLIHADGTTAACSEELEGRCCPGELATHAATARCEDFLGRGGCEICVLESFTARDWKHATHVATYARTSHRCAAHVRVRRTARIEAESDSRLMAALAELLRTP
ncbi:MAG TPA: hypothetical protein VE991_07215 [Acidimicrobiales bacterium]|nr:hypothetical protein [Acidimicrobiales bacterium]